ncbi:MULTISPECIES: hypothetical protein [Shewanella]|nr:hypothetical protein [Shewanella sp. Shew256]
MLDLRFVKGEAQAPKVIRAARLCEHLSRRYAETERKTSQDAE